MADDVPPVTGAAQPARGWVKGLLVVSLALNLLFLGTLAGAILRDGPPGRALMVRELNFGPLTEALSKDERDTLRRGFLRGGGDLRGQRRDIASDMAELLAVLRAPEFQRDRAEVLFTRQNERASRRQNVGQALVLDLMVAMTPEARAEFADRLEVAMTRGRKTAAP